MNATSSSLVGACSNSCMMSSRCCGWVWGYWAALMMSMPLPWVSHSRHIFCWLGFMALMGGFACFACPCGVGLHAQPCRFQLAGNPGSSGLSAGQATPRSRLHSATTGSVAIIIFDGQPHDALQGIAAQVGDGRAHSLCILLLSHGGSHSAAEHLPTGVHQDGGELYVGVIEVGQLQTATPCSLRAGMTAPMTALRLA